MNNFSNAPVDKDTQIINQQQIILNGIPALKQKWNWDGIAANSLIFNSNDVEALSDTELLEFIKEHSKIQINSSVTFSNTNGYRFVNYNFEAS